MQAYLEIGEFCKLVHLGEDVVKGMMANGSLDFKEEDGKIYIEASQGTFSVVPKGSGEPVTAMSLAGESFVEKTIGTILSLHEKVLDAKDETLETLKNENKFLKDVLYSMQEIYDEDRKTIDILNEQLARSQEEVEFMKRKYKLMWNKAVDNFTQGKAGADLGADGDATNAENLGSAGSASISNAAAGDLNSAENLRAEKSSETAASVNSAVNLAENLAKKLNSMSENSSGAENSTAKNSNVGAENSANLTQNSQNLNSAAENLANSAQSATNSNLGAENLAQNSQNLNSIAENSNSATNSAENLANSAQNPTNEAAQ